MTPVRIYGKSTEKGLIAKYIDKYTDNRKYYSNNNCKRNKRSYNNTLSSKVCPYNSPKIHVYFLIFFRIIYI